MPFPKHLKALLIDLDGTLADSGNILYNAYETLLKKRGLKPTQEEFSTLVGPTIKEAALILQKKYNLEPLYSEWKGFLVPYYQEKIALTAGSKELLELAKGRWKLALVTSAEEDLATYFLKRHNLKFDALICKEHIKASKPDPEPYLVALKWLDISAKEAIAIEDSENGVLSATRAGIHTLQITDTNKMNNITELLKKTYG